MSDNRPRGRASRGRARASPAVGPAGGGGGPGPSRGPGRGGASSQPPPQAQPPAPAQQPPRAAQHPAPATMRGKQVSQPPQPQPLHATQTYQEPQKVEEVTGAFRGMAIGSGKDVSQQRRGAMRGKTEIHPPRFTKPQSCTSKQGSSGHTCKITSNHFKLIKITDWSLYQYRVDFSPEEDRTHMRKILLRDHRVLLGDAYMFDGTMLFTIRRLPEDKMEVFSKRESDQQNIRITIKFTNELALGDYQYIQLFNIILRNCISMLDFQLVNREYFDPKQKEDLRNFKLEIWPGYVTSILQYENDVMLNIDVTHKVLRRDTVLDLMNECRQRYREDWQDKFTEAILGCVVFTHYNNKPYRVDDVDFASTPQSTFKKGNDDVQYATYYRERYGISIREMRQPLLVSRPKARDVRGGRDQNVVLVPELCNMTGLSNEMRSNFNLMKAVADKTRIPPNERIQSYYQFMKRMNSNDQVRTKQEQWNVKFANQLTELNGRRFDAEQLIIGNNRTIGYDESGDWARTFRNCAMFSSIELASWALIAPASLNDSRGHGIIDNFLQEMRRAANSLSFRLSPPAKMAVEQDKPGAYYTCIERALSKGNLQLVMCIVPNNKTDIYSSIKKKCCVDRPVASQVVTVKTLSHKNLLSIATKIVVQMNCKLGGTPWSSVLPFKTQGEPDATMVVGFDVCHDTNMKGRSFGALVASLDYYFTKFYSAVSSHQFGQELSNDIANHITHAVMRFKEINQKLPGRIIMFRDGVGDSNIPFVLDHEVSMIKAALQKVFPGWECKLAVVVVSKRIQTRLFVAGKNPPPGTIVDDVITQPEKYDFFLVSQSVRQGTVSPTSYNVIYDSTGLKADVMQKITYKMTHLYYNCSATVRVPAQVQYAHKLAFLVGQAIHQAPSPDLNHLLYFL